MLHGEMNFMKASSREVKLPALMSAAVYRGKQRVCVERIPLPEIRSGEVLVRIRSCGVCATDLKKVEYDLLLPPRVFGHEMAGEIVCVGKGVRGWKLGDRVVVFHHIPCGRCFYCERKEYAQCSVYKRTGTVAAFEPSGGGFAEYIRVLPWIVREGMVRIPSGVTFDEACMLEPVNTCLKGVDRLGLRRNDVVLVFGQGPIGLIFTQLIRARSGRPMALDLIPRRLKLARKLGAYDVLDPRSPKFATWVEKATGGRGADAAILAVPSEVAFQQALKGIRPGGRVMLFAHTKRGDSLSFDAGTVCVDEKTILGSYSSSIDIQPEVTRLVFSRKVKMAPLISHRFPLSRIRQAFHLASHPTAKSFKVIVNP